MKNSINILTTAILTSLIINVTLASNSGTSQIQQWFGNQNFSFTESGDVLSVDINKNPWEAFTLKVDNAEVMQNPVLNFSIASSESISLLIEISNGVYMSEDNDSHVYEVSGSGAFNQVACDFSYDLSELNLNEDIFVVFYVNPGQNFNGTVKLQNVNLTNSLTSTNDEMVSSFSVFPIPANSNLNVTLPDASYTNLVIIDLNGKVVFEQTLSIFDNSTVTLSVNDLARGTYVLKAFANGQSLESKIVLN